MQKVKIILRYLFSFLFFFSFLLLVLCVIIKYTVFNKDYIISTLEKKDYYNLVENDIKEEMEGFITSSGFDNNILNGIYSNEEIVNDINLYITNFYAGEKTNLNKENIEKNIKNNIDNYLSGNNIDVINKKDIEDFIDDITNIYKDEITLYSMIDSFSNTMKNINNILNFAVIGLVIITVILIIINLIIKQSYLTSSVISIGLVLLFLRLVVFDRIDVPNILIVSEPFSMVIIKVITHIESLLLFMGLGFVIIGIILSIIVKKSVKKKKLII